MRPEGRPGPRLPLAQEVVVMDENYTINDDLRACGLPGNFLLLLFLFLFGSSSCSCLPDPLLVPVFLFLFLFCSTRRR